MQEGGGVASVGRPKDRVRCPGGDRGAENLLVLVSENMDVAVVPVPSPLHTSTPQSMGR